MSESLSITRVDVLEMAKSFRMSGLCFAILCALNYYGIHKTDSYCDLTKIFPKFTRENAIPFGATEEGIYWWRTFRWECGRIDFLNWLIEQYKDDKEDLRKIEL